MITEIEWIPALPEAGLCGSADMLLCDKHGNIYIGFYDDDEERFYSTDPQRIELHNITHFAFFPSCPNKIREYRPDPIITSDDCIPKLHNLTEKNNKLQRRKNVRKT